MIIRKPAACPGLVLGVGRFCPPTKPAPVSLTTAGVGVHIKFKSCLAKLSPSKWDNAVTKVRFGRIESNRNFCFARSLADLCLFL